MTPSTQRNTAGRADDEGRASTNRVVLTGRLTAPPTVRVLPSGDELVTFRLSVPRAPTPGTAHSRLRHDWFDCAAWGGRVRASARGWAAGDVVRVDGVLRRRYLSGPAADRSRVEVEVLGGRRLAREQDRDRGESGRAAPE